jgi:hypothetical protein
MHTSPSKPILFLLLAGFVLASSMLGLNAKSFVQDGGSLVERVERAYDFFVHVWSESLLADVVFVVTSAGAAVLGVTAGRRWHALVAPLVGFPLAWAGYAVSFLFLDEGRGAGTEAIQFVLEWGWPGLVFAALAPALYIYTTPTK